MTHNVTVYSTGPACHKCNLTKQLLAKERIAYTEVRLDLLDEPHPEITKRGFTTAPVVHVRDTDQWWEDFRVDKIRSLIAAVNQ